MIETFQALAMRPRFSVPVALDNAKDHSRLRHDTAIDFSGGLDDGFFFIFLDNLEVDLNLIAREHIVPEGNLVDFLELGIAIEIMPVAQEKLRSLVEAFENENTGHNRRIREMV